jgi:hypothetical protein
MSIAYPTLLHEFRSEIKTNKIQNQWHFIFFVHSFLIALLFALCASPRRFMFKATCKALEEKIHKKSIFYKVSTRSVRKQKFMRQKESWFHGGGGMGCSCGGFRNGAAKMAHKVWTSALTVCYLL